MTRLMATGASLLPSFPQTLEGEGYSANLRQRMVPRYLRGSTFGTVANALDGSVAPQFCKMRSDCLCHANDVSARRVKSQRPKVEPIRQPTLFQMEKLDEAAEPGELKIERPYSLPGILLGTSAFTAAGWEGSFYPKGMRSADYLAFYAKQFATVEVDSTF